MILIIRERIEDRRDLLIGAQDKSRQVFIVLDPPLFGAQSLGKFRFPAFEIFPGVRDDLFEIFLDRLIEFPGHVAVKNRDPIASQIVLDAVIARHFVLRFIRRKESKHLFPIDLIRKVVDLLKGRNIVRDDLILRRFRRLFGSLGWFFRGCRANFRRRTRRFTYG